MSASAAHTAQADPVPLDAITVSRDVQAFDLLIEDMEAELGASWGDLTFTEAEQFLLQSEADGLRYVILAVDASDEGALNTIIAVTRTAKRKGMRVILVADGLNPLVMHELLRAGVDDFAPYPLPDRALADALDRARAARPAPAVAPAAPKAPETPPDTAAPIGMGGTASPAAPRGGEGDAPARVHAFQGIAGGVGTTTIAANLAMEAAFRHKTGGPSVCLIDLNLQFGAVATYLDLPRKDAVYELLADTASMDEPAFRQALLPVRERLHVLTAPREMLPLDLIGPEDVTAIIALARKCFDLVVIDVPSTLTHWTDTVMEASDCFHLVTTPEVRCAQNALRCLKLFEAEQIGTDGIAWILNRAPGRMDLSGRSRVTSMAESLGITFAAQLPDGGKAVTDGNDQAIPLMDGAARSPLRKEIAAMAARFVDGLGLDTPTRTFFGLRFG